MKPDRPTNQIVLIIFIELYGVKCSYLIYGLNNINISKSVGAVEYTVCISAKG